MEVVGLEDEATLMSSIDDSLLIFSNSDSALCQVLLKMDSPDDDTEESEQEEEEEE